MRPQPADGFAWVDMPAGPALVCRPLEPFARHLFTTRDWALGSPASDDGERRQAWDQLAGAMRSNPHRLARLRQVHGASVVVRRAGEPAMAPPPLPEADIVVSNDSTLTLAIQTADCVPILIADRRTRTVAAAHAGWRGLAARVPAVVVGAMAGHFGSRAEDLVVAIGPAISAGRYEVGGDVRARFEAAGFPADRLAEWFPEATRAEHWLFDGWQSARAQLVDAGVPPGQIHVARLCTAAHADLFCSYRRDGKKAGRLAAVLRPAVT